MPLEAAATPDWAVAAIVEAGRRMDRSAWVPATAGNISVRLDADRFAITRSGGHKGYLHSDHVMQVGVDGQALTPGRPSAETGLHTQLYRLLPDVGAVVHGHSVANTVLSLLPPGEGRGHVRFAGLEILKAFEGHPTHDMSVDVPVFANDQDISRLAAAIEPHILAGLPLGYLIAGHGCYIWGPDMPTALSRLEGLEFLLACELEMRKLAR